MSGETFPTVFQFKNYSKNSRVLTVLWDTLYNIIQMKSEIIVKLGPN